VAGIGVKRTLATPTFGGSERLLSARSGRSTSTGRQSAFGHNRSYTDFVEPPISLVRQTHLVEEGFPARVVVEVGKQGLEQHEGHSGVAVVVSLVQPVESGIDLAAESIDMRYLVAIYDMPLLDQLLKRRI